MTDDERLGPPPVEPMSDVAWSRVERGLWSRIDAAGPTGAVTPPVSRRWWLVAAPLAAVAAIVAIVVGLRTTDLSGADEPARVVSGSAPSSVSFGDSHLELDADTALAMSHESGHPVVLLERGAAWFTVAPRLQRPEFVVRAGDAMVRVVGTRFRVARSDERIAVDVDRGVVDVQFRGRVVAVGAGQHWSSESPGRATTLAATPPPVDPVASAEPAEPPPGAAEPAQPGRTPPAPKRTMKSSAKPAPAAGATAEPKPEPKLGTTQAADVDRERVEYERLAVLEPVSPDAARAGYLALARGTSRWAGLALFAAGRLAADRHDPGAETLLGIYLQRFPDGANATDARQLLARLKEGHL